MLAYVFVLTLFLQALYTLDVVNMRAGMLFFATSQRLNGEDKHMSGFAGIDVGYGDVKAIFDNGIQVKFPTAVSHESGGVLQEADKDEGLHVYRGSRYFVGELALKLGVLYPTRHAGFLETYAPLLAYEALLKGGMLGKCRNVAIGLPLGQYKSDTRIAMVRAFKEAVIDNEKLGLDTIDVFPQGVGVLFDVGAADNGMLCDDYRHDTLIIDIGYNTVDVVVSIDGKARKDRSGMIERGGISQICEKLSTVVQERYNFRMPGPKAKEVLANGSITLHGKNIDLTNEIQGLIQEYVRWIMAEIRDRWEDNIASFQKIVLAGGGAYILRPHLPSEYARFVTPKNPEFSNARGFLKGLKSKVGSPVPAGATAGGKA